MKKFSLIFALLLSVVCMSSCEDDYDDMALRESIESLENRMDAMEKVMDAYKNNLSIVSVVEITNGYKITFSDGSSVEIKNGTDGTNGDTLIQEIQVGEKEVVFILSDGTSFSMPINRFDMVLGVKGDRVSVVPGDVVEFSYELVNASDKAVVTVSSDGVYTTKVVKTEANKGFITVTCPDHEQNGYINVLAVDNGYTIARVIRFVGGDIEFNRGSDYTVAPEGKLLDLGFKVSFDYVAKVDQAAQSWISVSATRAGMRDEVLYLEVAPNTGDTGRVGKVYIYEEGYPDEIWATLTITQGVAAFTFEVQDLTENYLQMNVHPKDPQMTYLACISPSNQVKYLDDYELYYEQIKLFEQLAEMQSTDLHTVIANSVFAGDQLLQVGGLIPGREYTCYVFGLDAASTEMTGTMSRYDITTVSVEQIDVQFDINTVVNETEMNVTIKPVNYDGYYFTNVLQGYDESVTQEEIKEMIIINWADILATYMLYEDLSLEQALERLCAKGERTLNYTGAHDTKYAPFAVAINEKGMVCSDVAFSFVKTEPVKPSENILTISAENIKTRSVTMKINTTNEDPYVFFVSEEAVLEQLGLYTDEDILATLVKQVEENAWLKGNFEYEITDLLPETPYRLFAFGYDSGYATTKLFQTSFTTKSNVDTGVQAWVEYGAYYDAMEVGKLDPTYDMMAYPGAAFLPVVPKSEPAGSTMYFSFFYKEDLIGVADDVIKNILVSDIPADFSVPFTLYMPDYGTEVVICAVGQDADGNVGQLWTGNPVKITEQGVSDPAEFVQNFPWPFSLQHARPEVKAPATLKGQPCYIFREGATSVEAHRHEGHIAAQKGLRNELKNRQGELSVQFLK